MDESIDRGKDKLYQHIKTGEIKPLPDNVYKVVKRHWRPVPEAKEFSLKSEPVKQEPTLEQDPEISHGEIQEPAIQEESGDQSKESLQAEYEKLSGKKADGRWSVEKLIEKIEETKG